MLCGSTFNLVFIPDNCVEYLGKQGARMFRFFIVSLFMLAGCNSVYVKPNTLERGTKIYAADRGGYSMRRSIKERLEKRGYTVIVGRGVASGRIADGDSEIKMERNTVPNDARYYVNIEERREKFNPFWCPLNGFWWWNFNVSIADQKTGEELMTWRGRGCANSSLRKLDKILNKMEIKDVPDNSIDN